jgi:hypothetical protein
MREDETVVSGGITYSKADLEKMDPVLLRALLRERVHHNIEVPLYPTLLRSNNKPIESFGLQAQRVFDVWQERGFILDDPDIEWAKEYLALASKVRAGVKIEWNEPAPQPFSQQEMKTVEKLIFERHSIRNWLPKPVPEEYIQKILEAGRAAPNGCNLCPLRFIVISNEAQAKLVWSDISTKNAVIIVICFDTRISKVVGQNLSVPQNLGYDAAAAADHMLLMAHALGLGGVWLSKTTITGQRFKEGYELPEYLEPALHIAVGWPAIGTLKSKRMPLKEMFIK